MITRQGTLFFIAFALLIGLSACQPKTELIPTSTVPPVTATALPTTTPSPMPVPPTPETCLTAPGTIKQDVVPTTKPPQEFLIYLPPCYETHTEEHYPVLYLLHGQTYTEDQWVRLGVPGIADQLIHNGAHPFIVVFPDDRYWNVDAGSHFGERLINNLIPFVDENYRTKAERTYRSLGGLSRGGGWTVELGFEHPELFGSLGLHSPAIFKDNAPNIERIVTNIPEAERPNLWFDIGDADRELSNGQLLEQILTRTKYIHQFHLFAGDHSESYWGAHVNAYILWYVQQWEKALATQ